MNATSCSEWLAARSRQGAVLAGLLPVLASCGWDAYPGYECVEDGDCAGGRCENNECVAATPPTHHTLRVAVTGAGTVTSTPTGIRCGPGASEEDCGHGFLAGTSVVLTAAPGGGQMLAAWSGDCAGSDRTCRLTIDGPKSVGVEYRPRQWGLAVHVNGSGTVTSRPASCA